MSTVLTQIRIEIAGHEMSLAEHPEVWMPTTYAHSLAEALAPRIPSNSSL